MYYRIYPRKKNQTKRDCAQIVLEKILPFYGRAHIPMITPKKAVEKMIRLVERNAKSLKAVVHQKMQRKNLLAEVEKELAKTFILWPDNVHDLVKNEEDLLFLESMKNERKASFGALDMITKSVVDRKIAKEVAAAARKEKRQEGTVVRLRHDDDSSTDDVYVPPASSSPATPCQKKPAKRKEEQRFLFQSTFLNRRSW